MRRIGSLVVLTTLFMLGCEDKPTPPPPAVSATAAKTAAAPTAKPTAAASAEAPEEHGSKSHCPNNVEGSAAQINDVEGGVEIILTGKDDATVKEIRKRSAYTAKKFKAAEEGGPSLGSGSGRGKFGRCPVVSLNTTVAQEEVPNGAKITVKAKDPKELEWMRRETRERQAELGEPGAKEANKRRMTHCPSAVPGAATIIADTPQTVVVTVFSQNEAVQKEIRERAKLLMDDWKKDPKNAKLQGEDKLGIRRCPIIISETNVTLKDVPLGSEFTVKPDNADDMYHVMKEARERGEYFLGNEKLGPSAPTPDAGAPKKP